MKELFKYRDLLLERLEATAFTLAEVLRRAPDGALHKPLLKNDWTPHQVAAHLRNIESLAFQPRLESILVEDMPRFVLFEDRRYMRDDYDPAEPLAHILAAYQDLRAAQRQMLAALAPEAWNRSGRHPTWGVRTLQWWAEYSLAHAESHLTLLKESLS